MKVTDEMCDEVGRRLDVYYNARADRGDVREALEAVLADVPSPSEELKARLADALWEKEQAEAKLAEAREWAERRWKDDLLEILDRVKPEEGA